VIVNGELLSVSGARVANSVVHGASSQVIVRLRGFSSVLGYMIEDGLRSVKIVAWFSPSLGFHSENSKS
jgi:hypothetical protein